MKIFRLLMVCLLLHVKLYAQQPKSITLSLKNVPLETVLSQIKKQTGVSFFYKDEVLKTVGKITIEVQKAELKTVLDRCFQDTRVEYTVVGNIVTIAIKKEKKSSVEKGEQTDNFSQNTVRGVVYTTQGLGLGGANVIIKRSHRGTTTNAKGEFVLENVRTNDTLSVSYMGYARQELPVAMQGEFSIYMKETDNKLDEVLVQAYGTTTKRRVVGEITQINAEQIEKQPVTNVLLALQGQVPGMLVTPTSGYVGAPVRVEIRGRNSIANIPSDPLYVIDGTPLIIPSLGAAYGSGLYLEGSPGLIQSGISFSHGQSPLFSFNPGDIESITVLKDAAASAMYGSRSGNGVILITTKRGKPGTTRFDVNVDRSVQKSIGYWDMLNTSQYLEMRREALRNDRLTPDIANAPDLTLWDATRYVNWQKELWQTGKTTNVSTSLSGGNNFITFRLGANYSAIQNLSALSNQNKNQRASAILAMDYTSLNQKLFLTFSTSYSYTNTNMVGGGGDPTLPPNIPPILDEDGNLNYAAWNVGANFGQVFPFGGLLSTNSANTYALGSNIKVGYKVLKGLQISTSLSYNNQQGNTKTFQPIAAQNPIQNPTGSAFFGNNGNISLNIAPQIDYVRSIGKGELEAEVGGTFSSATGNGYTLVGALYTGDELLKSINNAPYKDIIENYVQEKYISVQGRLKYTWENKYIVQVNGNRDGSSSFGPGRQFGNFWSAGANWIASEEKWLKTTLPSWFSTIKFSGTYGTVGSYAGDAYQYLSQWSPSVRDNPLYYYNGHLPLVPIHAVNQDYRWSTSKKLNSSLTLGLLNDRFTLEVAYYRNRSDDQISQLPTPSFTGFETVKGNSKASVQNTGTEVSLTAAIIDANDFSWSARFNIGFNRNKLLAYPGIEFTADYTLLKVGNPLNTVYLLHYLGINPQTGERAYQDHNLDGKVSASNNGTPPGTGLDDRYITLNADPKFSGGAVTNLRYKRLALSLLFNFEKRMVPVAYTGTPGGFQNVPVAALNNHWQKPGDIALNPRFSTVGANSDSNFLFSDGAYTDGSYIRLGNVNISYALPDKFAKSLGSKGISVVFSMQNVFTLTKYDGIDAQIAFGQMPQSKTFNGSVKFSF